MSAPDLLTQQIAELVMANRVIRAPYYDTEHDEGVRFTDLERGLQWGADVVPALMGLFKLEEAPRNDRTDGWVGFARHWRGETVRIDFDLCSDHEESDPIVVVTGMFGRAGEQRIVDDDFGEIELPSQIPTEQQWDERQKQYQAARRKYKSDASAAVDAYIAALPGWKREIATQFDDVIRDEIPEVRRAVRYHQPFYGIEDSGWFASFSAFTNHVKLSFVSDTYVEPKPPQGNAPVRQALDVKAEHAVDEAQIASWVRQAASAPGMGW